MKRTRWMLVTALLVSIAAAVLAVRTVSTTKQRELNRRISEQQNQAASLRREGKLTESLQTLERLQVLLMRSGRYQDALVASFEIEAWSRLASDRESPWDYVRIAEAYLGVGDRESFLDWMERAVNERSFLKLDYFESERLNDLEEDPRFRTIVAACAAQIGVGRTAKDFHVPLLDGSSFALSAQKGKVVLVDFWDVRCEPCRTEMPNLKEVFSDFKDKGLEIIGISLDTDRALLERYLGQADLPWKIACSLKGWGDDTAKLYKISATPSTWLIDRNGIVRYYDLRGTDLRRAVEALIEEL